MRKPAPQAEPSSAPVTARLANANERPAAPAAPSVSTGSSESSIQDAVKPASRAAAPQAAGSADPTDS